MIKLSWFQIKLKINLFNYNKLAIQCMSRVWGEIVGSQSKPAASRRHLQEVAAREQGACAGPHEHTRVVLACGAKQGGSDAANDQQGARLWAAQQRAHWQEGRERPAQVAGEQRAGHGQESRGFDRKQSRERLSNAAVHAGAWLGNQAPQRQGSTQRTKNVNNFLNLFVVWFLK